MSPSKHVRGGGVSSLGRSHAYQPKPCTVGNLKPPLDCIKAQWAPPHEWSTSTNQMDQPTD